MTTQSQLSARRRVLVVPAAILAILLLPTAGQAQHGGHGGGHSSGHGGGHARSHGGGGGHSGGHASGGHSNRHGGGHSGYTRGHSSGAVRPHTGRHPSSHRHHRSHSSLFLHGSYYPYYYPYYPRYYGYGHYGYGTGPYPSGSTQAGGLDLDVSPADARVYVDGEYVGVVDDFDGFPSYLWLSPGPAELALELEGYRTVVRELRVVPGQILGVGDTLQPESAVAPAIPRRGSPRQPADGEWRAPSGPTDLRQQPGRLRLTIVPADAAVYLDGRFVGPGGELAQGLLVDAGRHELQVARPGRRSAAWTFEVPAGGEVERAIELEPQ